MSKKYTIVEQEDEWIALSKDASLYAFTGEIPLKKEDGILVMLGLKVDIKTIFYDKKYHSKKDIKKYLKNLQEKECPICNDYKTRLVRAFIRSCK